jgi:hypothetical protein
MDMIVFCAGILNKRILDGRTGLIKRVTLLLKYALQLEPIIVIYCIDVK